jgi:hypothetical protein
MFISWIHLCGEGEAVEGTEGIIQDGPAIGAE